MKKCLIFTLAVGIGLVAAGMVGRAAEPFAVTVSGQAGKPAILFIPGLACDGAVWKETVEHYQKTHECHVLTLAGFAGQPPVEGPFFDVVSKAVANYCAEKKLTKPIVIGHSLGASLALKLAAEHGEKIGAAIAVDGFACTMALFLPTATDSQRQAIGKAEQDKIMKQTQAEYTADTKKMFSNWLKSERLEQCSRWIEKSDRETVARAKGELFALDVRPQLKKANVPVLILAGYSPDLKHMFPNSQAFEKGVKAQLDGVAKGAVAVHPNCKHFIMWDEPKWMTDQIDAFLKK
ncbi:MAG: alpha/beta hydrolase [Gemmataceae bacterium]